MARPARAPAGLRYTAGEDAKAIIASRAEHDDAAFMAGLKAQFGF